LVSLFDSSPISNTNPSLPRGTKHTFCCESLADVIAAIPLVWFHCAEVVVCAALVVFFGTAPAVGVVVVVVVVVELAALLINRLVVLVVVVVAGRWNERRAVRTVALPALPVRSEAGTEHVKADMVAGGVRGSYLGCDVAWEEGVIGSLDRSLSSVSPGKPVLGRDDLGGRTNSLHLCQTP
jgi:hypothetical protein